MSAAVEKSIYLVIGHGDEVIRVEEADPMKARPNVPADTEIVLFEHCGGRLPTIIDCPLIKLFMDTSKAGRKLLENPKVSASNIKNKIGLPPRVYRAGKKHPEIKLTLQASWSKGKVRNKETYTIMKSGTFKYPLTNDNFPAIENSENNGVISRPLTNADCKKYSAVYTNDNYRRVILQAFEGSVFPKVSKIDPKGVGFTYEPTIYLSELIKKIKEIDPNPSIFYVVTCRALPKKALEYLRYHKKAIKNIRAASPTRPRLPANEGLKGYNEWGFPLMASAVTAVPARLPTAATTVPASTITTAGPAPNVAVTSSPAPEKKQNTTINNVVSKIKSLSRIINKGNVFVTVGKKPKSSRKTKKQKEQLKRNETRRRKERNTRLPFTNWSAATNSSAE